MEKLNSIKNAIHISVNIEIDNTKLLIKWICK